MDNVKVALSTSFIQSRTHTKTPSTKPVTSWFPYFSLPPSSWSTHCFYSWLIVHISVVVQTKAVLYYYPFHYGTTGTQRQRHCLALCPVQSQYPSFLCVTTNMYSAPCKQVLFVLSDYKYCFGKIIIKKRRDWVDVSIHQYKTHRIALLEDIPSFVCLHRVCPLLFFWLQH